MMTRALLGSLAGALLLTASLVAADVKLDGVKCVVNPKGPAKAENAVAYRGAKVYFCCQNCPKKFAADPTKFAVQANHQLAATGQAKQQKCPISGRDLDDAQKVTVGGTDVYFCCPNCKGKVASAEGAAQAGLVFSDKAFDKAFKVSTSK